MDGSGAALVCPTCRMPNRAEAKFCGHCGAKFSQRCTHCGKESSLTAKFCGGCGNSFRSLETAPAALTGPDAFQLQKQRVLEIINDLWSKIEPLWQYVDKSKYKTWFILGGVATTALAVALLIVNPFSSSNAPGSNSEAVASGQKPLVMYTSRSVNVRNGPTSVGTAVVGVIDGGQAISGTWVLGHDGITKWFKIVRNEGGYGYIWGNNLAPAKATYSDNVVWKRSDDKFYQNVSELVADMQQSGASSEAISFATKLSVARKNIPSWAVEYHHYGQIDLVLYDQSIGYGGGFVLVNGKPDMMVDPTISDDSLRSASYFFYSQHPNAFQLRGLGFMKASPLGDGGLRMTFLTRVGECEACGPEATFEYAYDFDKDGGLLGISVLGISSANVLPQISPPNHP